MIINDCYYNHYGYLDCILNDYTIGPIDDYHISLSVNYCKYFHCMFIDCHINYIINHVLSKYYDNHHNLKYSKNIIILKI